MYRASGSTAATFGGTYQGCEGLRPNSRPVYATSQILAVNTRAGSKDLRSLLRLLTFYNRRESAKGKKFLMRAPFAFSHQATSGTQGRQSLTDRKSEDDTPSTANWSNVTRWQ
jgi:hypothetical protein